MLTIRESRWRVSRSSWASSCNFFDWIQHHFQGLKPAQRLEVMVLPWASGSRCNRDGMRKRCLEADKHGFQSKLWETSGKLLDLFQASVLTSLTGGKIFQDSDLVSKSCMYLAVANGPVTNHLLRWLGCNKGGRGRPRESSRARLEPEWAWEQGEAAGMGNEPQLRREDGIW